MKNNKAFVKNHVAVVSLLFRVLTFSVILGIKDGLRIDESNQLMIIIAPVSIFCAVFFGKFIIDNYAVYQQPGQKLDHSKIIQIYGLLYFLNIAELLLIISKELFIWPDRQTFFIVISMFELGFCFYGFFYIANIFSANSNQQGTAPSQ